MDSSENEWVSGEETDRIGQAMLEGQYEDALQMLDALVSRRSVGWTFLLSRGITRMLLGDPVGAETDFRAFRDRPAPFPVPYVGAALWVQGRHQEACEDWAHEISRRRSGEITNCDEAGGVVVPALLWWASAHTGLEAWRKPAAGELKDRDQRNRRRKDYRPGPLRRWERWPGVLPPFLLGQSSEEALRSFIEGADPALSIRRCQAYFHLGARCLDAGDLDGYRHHLELAVNQAGDSIHVHDHHLARAELLALGQ